MPEEMRKIVTTEVKGHPVKIYIRQIRRKGTNVYDNFASYNNSWIPLMEFMRIQEEKYA